MWQWINDNAGLWGLFALPIALLALVPAVIQVAIRIRDVGQSTDKMHARLMSTRGRVARQGMRAATIGTREILSQRLRDDQDRDHLALAFVMSRLIEGSPVVITGEAGIGKSELLSELHRESYAIAQSPADPLVEVIPLASIGSGRNSHQDLLGFATRSIARRYRVSLGAVRSLVAESKIVLAFDGFDELSSDMGKSISSQILKLSLTVPVVVTSRPLRADGETSFTSDLVRVGRTHQVSILRLDWALAREQLSKAGVPIPDDVGAGTRSEFCNPLNLQILIFLWNAKLIDRDEVKAIFADPTELLPRFIRTRTQVGPDPALLLATLMSADSEKPTSVTFRILPIQFGGLASTVTVVATLVAFVGVVLAANLWRDYSVTVIATVIAIVLMDGGPAHWIVTTIVTIGKGSLRSIRGLAVYFVVLFLFTTVLIQLCRVVAWSIQAGSLQFGDLQDLLDPRWFSLYVIIAIYEGAPMKLASSYSAWGGYMTSHAWPQFSLLVVGIALLVAFPDSADFRQFIVITAYFAAVCLHFVVAGLATWFITRTPPWRWRALLNQLVLRGVLCADNNVYKFTHARIEQTILTTLAVDPRTPRLVWAVFGDHWPDLVLDKEVAPLLAAGSSFDRLAIRMSRRLVTEPSGVNSFAGYFEWVSPNPEVALAALTRHMRRFPRSSMRPLLFDAMDRAGIPRGRSLAARALQRGPEDVFELNWLLRALERHDSYQELSQKVIGLRLASSDAEFLDFLAARLGQYELSGEFDPEAAGLAADVSAKFRAVDLAALALEATPPDFDAALSALMSTNTSSLAIARLAQLCVLRSDVRLAREHSRVAINRLRWDNGSAEFAEVMITAAVIDDNSIARTWVEGANVAGLRLRGRPGLLRVLQASDEDPAAKLIAPRGWSPAPGETLPSVTTLNSSGPAG